MRKYLPMMDMLKALQELIDLDAAGALTEWERDFVLKMHDKYFRTWSLSDKERYRVEQIYKKHLGEDE